MSENAERPARSRPRIGADGAADLIEREITAADQAERSGRPHRACNHGRGSGRKERTTASSDPRPCGRQGASSRGKDLTVKCLTEYWHRQNKSKS